MAKKKSANEPTKGQLIEQYLAEYPDTPPSRVVEELAIQGIKVSLSLVNNVKRKLRGGRKKARKAVGKKTAAQPQGPLRAATAARGTDLLSANDLFEAKKLAEQLGGIKQAKQALETLERLREK